MNAHLAQWVLAGLLSGAALAFGGCQPEEDASGVAGRGERVRMGASEAWTPPAPSVGKPSPVEEGVGGAGAPGVGEPLGTGIPEDAPISGGPSRSDYTGPEPVITPPFPTQPLHGPAPQGGG